MQTQYCLDRKALTWNTISKSSDIFYSGTESLSPLVNDTPTTTYKNAHKYTDIEMWGPGEAVDEMPHWLRALAVQADSVSWILEPIHQELTALSCPHLCTLAFVHVHTPTLVINYTPLS